MGSPQSSHGLPTLWHQDPRQQQRTCRFYIILNSFDIKCVPADEDRTEGSGEETVRCSDEADVLRSVCGRRGEIFPNVNNLIILSFSVRTPGPSPPPSTE